MRRTSGTGERLQVTGNRDQQPRLKEAVESEFTGPKGRHSHTAIFPGPMSGASTGLRDRFRAKSKKWFVLACVLAPVAFGGFAAEKTVGSGVGFSQGAKDKSQRPENQSDRLNMAFTSTRVSLAAGSYFHCLTAWTRASTSKGCPPSSCTSLTAPSGVTVNSTRAAPCMRSRRANSGYWGGTRFLILRPASLISTCPGFWYAFACGRTARVQSTSIRNLLARNNFELDRRGKLLLLFVASTDYLQSYRRSILAYI